MKTGPCLARLWMCAAVITGSVPAQDDDAIQLRLRSLASLTTPLPANPVLPFWSLLELREENLAQRDHAIWAALVHHRSEPVATCEIDTFVALLHELDSRFEDGTLECQAEEDKIVMFGEKKVLDEVMVRIAKLEASLTAPITVEVTIIEHDGKLSPPSVLDAAQARGLFEGHEPLWVGRARTTCGQPSSLGSYRARPYSGAAHAEVAEKSQVIHSVQRDLFAGTAVTVVPYRLVGTTDLAVAVQFAVGRLQHMGEHDAHIGGIPMIDAPRLAVDTGSMSARVANGGALVYSVTSEAADGGSLAIVVRATAANLPDSPHEDLDILPAALLTRSCREFPFEDEESRVPAATWAQGWPDSEAGPAFDDGRLQDLIRSTVTPDAWDDVATLNYMNGRLIAVGSEESRKGARQVLLSLQEAWSRTSEVEFRAGAGDEPRLRISFPALHGRNHALMHGVETTALDGEFVEIAADSGVMLPQVVDLLHGIRAGVCVQVGRTGGLHLQWRESVVGKHIGRPRLLPPVDHAQRSFLGTADNGAIDAGPGLFGEERWSVRPVR